MARRRGLVASAAATPPTFLLNMCLFLVFLPQLAAPFVPSLAARSAASAHVAMSSLPPPSAVVVGMGFNPFSPATDRVGGGDDDGLSETEIRRRLARREDELASVSARLADALDRVSDLEGRLSESQEAVRRGDAVAAELRSTVEGLRSELRRAGGGVGAAGPAPANGARSPAPSAVAAAGGGGFFQMMEARRAEADARRAEAAAAREAYAEAKRAEAAVAKKAFKKSGPSPAGFARLMSVKRAEADARRAKAAEARTAYEEAKRAEAAAAKKAFAEARKLPFEQTTVEVEKSIPKLDDWRLEDDGSVMGTVSGHSSIADGTVIVTSTLANPSTAAAFTTVETLSGSKYRLGNPMTPVDSYGKTNQKSNLAKKALAELGLEFSGEIAGDGKYLLAVQPKQSPSKRSKIYTAYRTDDRGLPKGKALAIKVSSNFDAMKTEDRNYQRVAGGFSRWKDYFIRRIEFLKEAGSTPQLRGKCALVMELGREDIKEHLERQGKGLEGRELHDAAKAAAKCVEAVHAAGLVWTDLKTENFVYVEDSDNGVSFKGIDLESARERGTTPVDYSPEACPPEFAEVFLAGDAQSFRLDYSYDVWSLGVFMYELCTGRGQFDGKTPIEITKFLPTYRPALDDIPDSRMADLIAQCLQPDPKRRPSSTQVLLHPYFLTTKLGFF